MNEVWTNVCSFQWMQCWNCHIKRIPKMVEIKLKRSTFGTIKDFFFRSIHRRCSIKRGVLENLAKFTGKHPCQSLFFNKVAGLRPATISKKGLWHRCFPVNFVKFLRTPTSLNTSGRLLVFLLLWKLFYRQNSWFSNILVDKKNWSQIPCSQHLLGWKCRIPIWIQTTVDSSS